MEALHFFTLLSAARADDISFCFVLVYNPLSLFPETPAQQEHTWRPAPVLESGAHQNVCV